jgi:hypothetical protein
MSWRYRRRDYGWGGFAPYVSKAERMRQAEKARAKLLKQEGAEVQPVALDGHAIARTWWGHAWNQNLERYADCSNRLPRGRSYVRNGSVLDLRIAATAIKARAKSGRVLAAEEGDLSKLFGIAMDDAKAAARTPQSAPPARKGAKPVTKRSGKQRRGKPPAQRKV